MDITNINHVGMVVRDLPATTVRYEAMGFQLTPYSPHSGAWRPGAPVQPLGSGNRCVMFGDNYLEILASENPARPAERMTNFLAHHQGAHIVCFDTDDCGAVDKRLRAAGIETSSVIPLQRDIDTPEGVQTARFERVQFAPKDTPEGYIQAARHLTPQYIYQPRYIAHANGCSRLSEVVITACDLDAIVRRYEIYTGVAAIRVEASVEIRLPLGTALRFVASASISVVLPGTLLPPLPGIAGVVFRQPDLKAQTERLRRHGITVNAAGKRLLVPAEEASGVAVLFEA